MPGLSRERPRPQVHKLVRHHRSAEVRCSVKRGKSFPGLCITDAFNIDDIDFVMWEDSVTKYLIL